jgi:hypothetical protein
VISPLGKRLKQSPRSLLRHAFGPLSLCRHKSAATEHEQGEQPTPGSVADASLAVEQCHRFTW